MKNLILILTILFIANVSMAQQVGKKTVIEHNKKTTPTRVDTTGPDKIPRGATIEDLISKLPGIAIDTNGNVASIKMDCRDVAQPANSIVCEIVERVIDSQDADKIIYKVDTIQYKASFYRVSVTAKLDELLKVMKAFEINTDGIISHQASVVTALNINGKAIAVLDIPRAIKIIPADAIEVVEVVDDYSRIVMHKSIKPSDIDKLLNITLKKGEKVDLKKIRTGR